MLPPRLLFPRGLLVQDVSCDPKVCSSHPEHPELLLEPCGRLGAVGWAPFMMLCRNSSCQTLATRPRGLWGSSTGAEGALEPPSSSIRDFLLREPGGGMQRAPHYSLRAASHADLCLPQAGAAAFGEPRPHSHICQELPELLPNFPLAPGGEKLRVRCSQLGSGTQVPSLAQERWAGAEFCSFQPFAYKYQLYLFQWGIWGVRRGHSPGSWLFMPCNSPEV